MKSVVGWEYRRTNTDGHNAAWDLHAAEMAHAGWELVNASVVCEQSIRSQGMQYGQQSFAFALRTYSFWQRRTMRQVEDQGGT